MCGWVARRRGGGVGGGVALGGGGEAWLGSAERNWGGGEAVAAVAAAATAARKKAGCVVWRRMERWAWRGWGQQAQTQTHRILPQQAQIITSEAQTKKSIADMSLISVFHYY